MAEQFGNVDKNIIALAEDVANGKRGIGDLDEAFSSASKSSSAFGATLKSVAANVAIAFAVDIAIQGLIKLADYIIVTREEIEEAAQAAQSAVNSARENFNNIESTVSSVKDRYAELAQGVKQTGNEIKNINLTPDEYDEFLSLSNQLADLSPALVSGYDSQGNAILNLSGDVDTITSSLDDFIEKQRELANLEIAENMPDLFAGTLQDSNDIKNEITRLEKQNQNIEIYNQNLEDIKNSIKSGNKSFNLTDTGLISQYRDVLQELGIAYREYAYGIDADTSTVVFDINASEEEINKAISSFSDKVSNLSSEYLTSIGTNQAKIAAKQQELNQTWTSLSDEMFAAISTTGGYKILSDDMKKSFQGIFNNIDWASMNVNSWDDAQKWIEDNLLNVFNGIDKEYIQSVFNDALNWQEMLESGAMSVGDYQKSIAYLLGDGGMVEAFGEAKSAVQKAFKYTSQDGATIEDMIGNVKEKISDEMDGAIESMSLEDLEIAYNIENKDMTFDQLQSKILQTKKLAETGFDINARTNLNAYNDVKGSDNGGSYRADYDSYTAMMKEAKDLYDASRTGNETFKAAAKAFSMNGMDDAVNFAENYAQLSKYFTEDSSGLETFVQDLEKIGKAEWNGKAWVLDMENMQEAADQLYMPLELLTVLMQGLQEYDFTDDYFGNIDDAGSHITELYDELSREEAKLADMQSRLANGDTSVTKSAIDAQTDKVNNLKNSIDTTIEGVDQLFKALSVDELSTEYEQAESVGKSLAEQWKNLQENTEISSDAKDWIEQKLKSQIDALSDEYGIKINLDTGEVTHSLDEVKSKLEAAKTAVDNLRSSDGKLNLDDSDVQAAINDYRDLKQQQFELTKPTIMSVDTSNATAETEDVITKLQRAVELSNQIDTDKELNLDTSEAEKELNNIFGELNGDKPAEIMAKLNIEGTTPDEILSSIKGAGTIEIPAELQKVQQLEIDDQQANVTFNITNKDELEEAKATLESLPPNTQANVTINTDNVVVAQEAAQLMTNFPDANATINLKGAPFALVIAGKITDALNGIPDIETTIDADNLASKKISTVKQELNNLDGKTATTYINTVRRTTTVGSRASVDGTAHALGTAHANGTVGMALWNRYFSSKPGSAYVKGDWRLPHDENALVGELGAELLVRDGKASLIGINGAEFKGLKKNDILFNHKQTEALLRYGYITGRGKPIGFTSHVMGTVNSYAGGSTGSFGGYQTTKTSSSSQSSSGTTTATKANTKAVSANTKSVDDLKEKFDSYNDWIAKFIQAFDKQYAQMERMANDLQDSYKQQNATINQMISLTQKFQSNYEKMYDEYMNKAYASGLSPSYQKKVIDGAINIESITDESLKEKISEFEKWYSAAADLQNKIQDLNVTLKELYNQKLENIEDDYSRVIDYYDAMTERYKGIIEMREAIGKNADGRIIEPFTTALGGTNFESYYNSMMSNTITKLDLLYKQYNEMNAELTRMVKNGQIRAYSDDWYEWQTKLQEIFQSIDDAKTQYAEIRDEVRAYHWKGFNANIETLDYNIKELQDVLDHLNSDNFVDELGNITEEGDANITLIATVLDKYKQKLADYTTAVKKLDEELKNGVINQEQYTEYVREYLDAIRETSGAIDDYKNQLIDLYKQQIDIENDTLQKNISLRKEALQKKKDYYDYDKTIRDKNKDINALKSQIAAMEGVTSASGKVELARLKAQLAEAEDDLNSTKIDHQFEMMSTGYDELSDKADEAYDAVLDSLTRSTEEQERVINEMLERIKTSYKDAYSEIAQTITDAGILLSKDTQKAIDSIGTSSGAANASDKAQTANSDVSSSSTANNVKTSIDSSAKTDKNTVTSISLNKSSATIAVGGSVKLTASVSPAGTTNPVSWSSSNTGVATVSGGTVTGKKAGTAKITATCGMRTATCTITVKATTTSSGGSSNTSTSNLKTATNTTDGHNLRDAAGYSGNIITSMPKGSTVTLLGDKKEADGLTWYKVKYGNKTGWTSSYYLKFAKGVKDLKKRVLALTNEEGPEMVISPLNGQVLYPYEDGIMMNLNKGDSVIKKDFADNVMDVGKIGVDGLVAKTVSNVKNLTTSGGNEYNYGDLAISIYPTQKLDRQEMDNIGDFCYDYWTKRAKKDVSYFGGRKIK